MERQTPRPTTRRMDLLMTGEEVRAHLAIASSKRCTKRHKDPPCSRDSECQALPIQGETFPTPTSKYGCCHDPFIYLFIKQVLLVRSLRRSQSGQISPRCTPLQGLREQTSHSEYGFSLRTTSAVSTIQTSSCPFLFQGRRLCLRVQSKSATETNQS